MNKNFLWYGVVFFTGAIITPPYLSLFSDNPSPEDPPPETVTESTWGAGKTFLNGETEDSPPTQVIVPKDEQKALEEDYGISEGEVRIPTSLPQYAYDQPEIDPYPNYSAIRAPQIIPPKLPQRQPQTPPPNPPRATVAQEPFSGLNAPILLPKENGNTVPDPDGDRLTIPEGTFTPPRERPDPDAAAPLPFNPSDRVKFL